MDVPPKVSIIVPIYNVEPYLKQCVDSLRQQTLAEIEMILVDDGSPDNCPRLCDQFAAEDGRIQVIHQENAGLSAARNRGMDAATGDWIMFVDPDDWLDSDAAEVLYQEAAQDGSDIVCGTFYKNYPGRQKEVRPKKGEAGEYWTEQSLEQLLGSILRFRMIDVPLRCAWGKIYRKSIIDDFNCRFQESLKNMEDGVFNLQVIRHVDKVSVLDRPIYHYRIRPQSNSKKFYSNQLAINRQCAGEVREFLKSIRRWEDLRYLYDYVLIFLALKTALMYGGSVHSRQDFRRAWRLIRQFCEEPDCVRAIADSRVCSMPDRKSRWGLFLLKLRMYRTIELICVLYGRLFIEA